SFILSSSNRCILLYSFLKQSVSTLSYTLSLHDALPICLIVTSACMSGPIAGALLDGNEEQAYRRAEWFREIFGEDFYIEVMSEKDRKSTRLNSSHVKISYAVFCLKKKNNWLTFFSEYQE